MNRLFIKGRIIDFYAGLGGASEAFVQDGRYQVVRIDNNVLLKDVEHMYIEDIPKLNVGHIDMLFGKADLMIFAPPCREFSLGYNAPRAIASRKGQLEQYKPDMAYLKKAIEIIKYCKPKNYIIENVQGACRYFEEYLGKHTQQIGPFYLWHNLPLLSLDKEARTKLATHKQDNDVWSTHPLRSNIKAKWPIELSQALLMSFSQPTLEEWL